jgi:foldase protein PrsA
MSKQRKIPTPSWEQHHTGLPGGMTTGRARVFATIGIVAIVVVAIGVIGAGFFMDWLDERQLPGSTAIKVDDRDYSVEEVTERVRLFSAETGNTQTSVVIPSVSSEIIDEAVLLKFAEEKGVTVTEEEVKAEIAEILAITVDDPNFDTIYQEEIKNLDLTEEEYRDYARGRVLDDKVRAKFKEELPATVESVHYRQIQVADQAVADDVKAQLDAGADFAALAAQYSTDTESKDKGGDQGWVPRGVLSDAQEDILFSLDPNEIAVYPTPGGQVFIYQGIEVSDAQPVAEDYKESLAATNYADWKAAKQESMTVTNHLDFQEGDVDKIDYVVDNADLTSGV